MLTAVCGIVGLVGDWPSEALGSLNDALRHRGPDDSGEYLDPEGFVRLATRRLSILDVEGGHQPMGNDDSSVWVVFNGEIFNSPELRDRLTKRGHRFRTLRSDTECLLRLYEDRGEEMLADLNGMFAFVVYDRRRQRLFGARDPFGIKPLYYTRSGSRFAFASELKALLRLPALSRQIDLQSLFHYLSLRYVPGERSIFKGVARLGPGQCFVYDLERRCLVLRRYWRPDWTRREEHSVEEWSEILRQEMRAAVRRWVLSDVPVACSLSGGLDSSSIVGLLAEAGYPRLRTYSLGFTGAGEDAWNELDLARQVAARWGTDHHELTLSPDVLLDDLVSMVWHLDEPYGGGLPSWHVLKFMARDVKVALTGTGGDELFGGYGKWLRYERSLLAPRSLGIRAKGWLLSLPAAIVGADRKAALRAELGPFGHPLDAYPLYLSDTEKRERVVAFPPGELEDTTSLLRRLYEEAGAGDVRDGMAHVDLGTQLPEEFLLMTDRFSMAHSVEARVPFLDKRLAARALSIPGPLRTSPRDLKYLLRRATGDLLPEDLLRAPKRGFVLPDRLWLRGKLRPLVDRLLAPDRLRSQGLLRPEVYAEYARPHLEGRRDRSGQLWTLMMFQLWHAVFVEQRSVEAPAFTWRDLAK